MIFGGLQKFSLSDYPEHPSAVVFAMGCNMNCPWCHNLDIAKGLAEPIPEDVILDFLDARRLQLHALVISGGEPTAQNDFPAFLAKVRNMGFLVKLDTNGTNPNMLDKTIELLNFVAMDIKAPMDRYTELTNTEMDWSCITQSIKIIKRSGVKHQFRTTLLPELTWEDQTAIKCMVPTGGTYKTQPFIPNAKKNS